MELKFKYRIKENYNSLVPLYLNAPTCSKKKFYFKCFCSTQNLIKMYIRLFDTFQPESHGQPFYVRTLAAHWFCKKSRPDLCSLPLNFPIAPSSGPLTVSPDPQMWPINWKLNLNSH